MSITKDKSAEEILYEQQSVIRIGEPGCCGYIQADAVGLITKATPGLEDFIDQNIAYVMDMLLEKGIPMEWEVGQELDG